MYYYRHPSIHVQHGGVPGTPTNIKQEQEQRYTTWKVSFSKCSDVRSTIFIKSYTIYIFKIFLFIITNLVKIKNIINHNKY